jgi:hypothetical protein
MLCKLCCVCWVSDNRGDRNSEYILRLSGLKEVKKGQYPLKEGSKEGNSDQQ